MKSLADAINLCDFVVFAVTSTLARAPPAWAGPVLVRHSDAVSRGGAQPFRPQQHRAAGAVGQRGQP